MLGTKATASRGRQARHAVREQSLELSGPVVGLRPAGQGRGGQAFIYPGRRGCSRPLACLWIPTGRMPPALLGPWQ